jgi:hypothetical protein
MMPIGLASSEMTTLERCEFLLGVIACSQTNKRPQELFPWVKAGLAEFDREVLRGA